MAQKSFFWTTNNTGDGTSGGYTALEFSEIWRDVLLGGGEASQGILRGVGNELAVTGTSSPVAVNTGSAIVYGKFYRNTASVNVTVSTPSVGTTGGHIILQLDWTAQTVRVVNVRNTDGVNSTPALVQSLSTTWEIRLASYTITTGGVITLTDVRADSYFGTKVKTAMLDDNAVTTVKITDNAVTTAKIADANVTTVKILDANVTTAKIADNNITTAKILDANVTTAKVANDAIDDTKAGNRVPQFRRRQGNDASDWSAAGTTTYTPTSVRQEVGSGIITGGASHSGTLSVTFPEAYSNPPVVIAGSGAQDIHVAATTITSTGFVLSWKSVSDSAGGTFVFYYFTAGPE